MFQDDIVRLEAAVESTEVGAEASELSEPASAVKTCAMVSTQK